MKNVDNDFFFFCRRFYFSNGGEKKKTLNAILKNWFRFLIFDSKGVL